MKKKKCLITAAIMLGTAVGLAIYKSYLDYWRSTEDDVLLQNVEALTSGDVSSGYFLWQNLHYPKLNLVNGIIVMSDSVKGVCKGRFIQTVEAERQAKIDGYDYNYCHSHSYRICNTDIPIVKMSYTLGR